MVKLEISTICVKQVYSYYLIPPLRWTIKLAMDLIGEMMGVSHSVDSEDLVHCDLMAICAFFVALLMRGLQFKQALAVVNRTG